jgi:hypothetical protein
MGRKSLDPCPESFPTPIGKLEVMPVNTLTTVADQLMLQPYKNWPQEIGAPTVLAAAAPPELDVPCTVTVLDGATINRTESAT